ncbi:MAG: MinD/ParA family ATP-binding protein, partial [Candidatus Dormibacteraceae bacterium]
MSYILSWVGIKDGQGVTTSAAAVAYELARDHPVLVIDADQSGTGTLVDLLQVDPGARGMARFAGNLPAVTAAMLREEATLVTGRRALYAIAGLNGLCGKPVYALVAELERGRALSQVPFPYVVVDWGSAWSHATLDSPARAAEAVCRISDRVFVQVADSPALLTRGITVLRQARPPRAELLLLARRRNELGREVRGALAAHLPHLELATTVRWDPRAAQIAEDRCTTME